MTEMQPPQSHPNCAHVTVTSGVRGFFAVLMVKSDCGEFWEPANSGMGSYKTAAEAIPEALEWASIETVPFYLAGYDAKGQPLIKYPKQVVPSLVELVDALQKYDRSTDPGEVSALKELVIALARKVAQDEQLAAMLLVAKQFVQTRRIMQGMGIASMLPAFANTYLAAQVVLDASMSLLFPPEER